MGMTPKHLPLALALAFALKSLLRPDLAGVVALALWLALYAALEFFGPLSEPERTKAEREAREKEIEDIRATLKHVTLTLGIRGGRIHGEASR